MNVLQQMQTTKGLVFRLYPLASNSTVCRSSYSLVSPARGLRKALGQFWDSAVVTLCDIK